MPAAPYVVRERVLPAHIRPHAPIVWDVTEAHTRRAVAYGVHVCPDRAHAHADRLTRRAQEAALQEERADQVERAADRARIGARLYRDRTNLPFPCTATTSPAPSSSDRAARTVPRETPY